MQFKGVTCYGFAMHHISNPSRMGWGEGGGGCEVILPVTS